MAWLAGLNSLSIAGDRRNSDTTEMAAGDDDDSSVSSSVSWRSSYRSLQSICEIDLFPAFAISDLHTVASCMAAAGYAHEAAMVPEQFAAGAVMSARLAGDALAAATAPLVAWREREERR
ncbi:hypothetical protein BS78_10G124100 [Paspalum vaginatum]|nr:hypothetical protein BS78_10G124100 [Paspalum vaginatum]